MNQNRLRASLVRVRRQPPHHTGGTKAANRRHSLLLGMVVR